MRKLIYTSYLPLLLLGSALTLPAVVADDWIDVHFHVVGDEGKKKTFASAADQLVAMMDRYNMERVIVMSPPRPFQSYDIDELVEIHKRYPERVAFLGGGGTLNPMIQAYGESVEVPPQVKEKFERTAEQIIASGASGFGEITAHHVSLGRAHAYERVSPDHPLLLLLADIAARHDVPVDLHFDPVPRDVATPPELDSPKNPAVLRENIVGFENLLAHNRDAKIVWAHAGSDPVGFYTPDLVRRLLGKHPNLYLSVRTTHKRNDPMRHPRFGINRDWIAVLEEFPDRFVMGTDSFLVASGYTGPNGPRVFERKTHVQREGANDVLAYLDDDLARRIGSENAKRLYKLDIR